jgi:hypothetical protein
MTEVFSFLKGRSTEGSSIASYVLGYLGLTQAGMAPSPNDLLSQVGQGNSTLIILALAAFLFLRKDKKDG